MSELEDYKKRLFGAWRTLNHAVASGTPAEVTEAEEWAAHMEAELDRLIAERERVAVKALAEEALKVDQLYPGGSSLRDFLNHTVYQQTTEQEMADRLATLTKENQ